eukprot:1679120-Pleurochrysis_carterae.AAC.7
MPMIACRAICYDAAQRAFEFLHAMPEFLSAKPVTMSHNLWCVQPHGRCLQLWPIRYALVVVRATRDPAQTANDSKCRALSQIFWLSPY